MDIISQHVNDCPDQEHEVDNHSSNQYKQEAVSYLGRAVKDWQAYSRESSVAYRPQLFSRTHYLDWQKILEDVKQEVEAVRNE